jgi:hypothetical protein
MPASKKKGAPAQDDRATLFYGGLRRLRGRTLPQFERLVIRYA